MSRRSRRLCLGRATIHKGKSGKRQQTQHVFAIPDLVPLHEMTNLRSGREQTLVPGSSNCQRPGQARPGQASDLLSPAQAFSPASLLLLLPPKAQSPRGTQHPLR